MQKYDIIHTRLLAKSLYLVHITYYARYENLLLI